jgi:thymidylate synthase (FAD)
MSQLKVSYVNHMGSDLTIVNSARISFGTESQVLEDRDKKLIKYLADNQHMSPFEHCVLSVEIQCPLYIRSQIHRHRTFSYNEVSRRYTSENLEFFVPETVRRQAASNRQASEGELDPISANTALAIMKVQHEQSLDAYNDLLALGVPRETARGVLCQDLLTRFIMTGNLRNWIHFVKLRIDNHAQAEVQEIGKQVLAILEEKFPEATKALLGVK